MTTSKSQQFCATSSILQLDNDKNKASLRGFLSSQNWQHQKRSNSARRPSKIESWVRADGMAPIRLAFFQSMCPNYCACHETVMPSQTKCRTCHTKKSILANLKIWCSKMQPFSGNQPPDLRTSLTNMSLVLRLPRERHLSRSSASAPPLPSLQEILQNLHVFAHFWTCERPKMLWTLHFSLHFWLRHVLPPLKRACTFSTCQILKVVQAWCALCILTWKRASRHNGVQFLISHLPRSLRTRRFSEPTFRPSGATHHWKNRMHRDFPHFSPTCLFFLLPLSLLWSSFFFSSPLWLFPPLLFHLSMLSKVWLLNLLQLQLRLQLPLHLQQQQQQQQQLLLLLLPPPPPSPPPLPLLPLPLPLPLLLPLPLPLPLRLRLPLRLLLLLLLVLLLLLLHYYYYTTTTTTTLLLPLRLLLLLLLLHYYYYYYYCYYYYYDDDYYYFYYYYYYYYTTTLLLQLLRRRRRLYYYHYNYCDYYDYCDYCDYYDVDDDDDDDYYYYYY